MGRVIIDVREPFEFALGHVKGTLNIPLGRIGKGAPGLAKVSKNDELIVYCRTGGRSGTALQILKGLGYSNVTNGINKAQVEANYPG